MQTENNKHTLLHNNEVLNGDVIVYLVDLNKNKNKKSYYTLIYLLIMH